MTLNPVSTKPGVAQESFLIARPEILSEYPFAPICSSHLTLSRLTFHPIMVLLHMMGIWFVWSLWSIGSF